ncbi:hypothetical protein [Bradyrhizobium sp. CCBAU 45384]|uniref:hypothetical protein n=1 Tax=Bradyrhizobium sp. CCBAU 45384 TaxID=858428 RepID=UPI00230630E0|nr:hypothetical protein [Bradyrhizobium sp. CCBAU 45384]
MPIRQVQAFFRDRFKAMLASAVRHHPLGFLYMSEQIAEGTHLRYHFWPEDWLMPSLEQGKEDHDHSYRLTSIIVAGELRHQTFEAAHDANGTHEIFEVCYYSGDSALVPTGQVVRVACSGDQTYSAGECYTLSPGVIHRATPIKLPTATIVVTVDAMNMGRPRVLAEVGDAIAASSFHRGGLTASEIEKVSAELVRCLPA